MQAGIASSPADGEVTTLLFSVSCCPGPGNLTLCSNRKHRCCEPKPKIQYNTIQSLGGGGQGGLQSFLYNVQNFVVFFIDGFLKEIRKKFRKATNMLSLDSTCILILATQYFLPATCYLIPTCCCNLLPDNCLLILIF